MHWSDCPEFIAVQRVMRASGPRASSLRAFYAWLIAAFVAGAIGGAAAASAFSGAPSTAHNTSGASSALTSAVDGGPVRAEATGMEARASVHAGSTPESAEGAARTTATHPADDVLPASASPRDDPAAVVAAIDAAAEEFGHDPERMRVVAFCESRWDPRAIGDNGTSFGAWQFQMATWRANVRRAGFAYSDEHVFDPIASSRVAAWMWANGGELLWTCAR